MPFLLRLLLLGLVFNALLFGVASGQTPSAPSMFIDRRGQADQALVWCVARSSLSKSGFAVSGWVRTGPYANRAFHVEHTSARDVVAFAFRSQAERIQWDNSIVDSLFDIEVVVPKENESTLASLVQSTIQAFFGIAPQWVTKETEVAVLEMDSTKSPPFVQPSASRSAQAADVVSDKSETRTDHGISELTAASISPNAIATVLQRDFKMVVIDETHCRGRAPVKIAWKQGDWTSVQEAVGLLGLRLTKAQRSTQVLVVRPIVIDPTNK